MELEATQLAEAEAAKDAAAIGLEIAADAEDSTAGAEADDTEVSAEVVAAADSDAASEGGEETTPA
jgi:hypothetical protein